MLQVRLNAPSFANVAPPPVALNVNASSNPTYSQRLSTDTLQRSGNAVSATQKAFETALYARKHKPGSLGYLVKWEHDLQAKRKELEGFRQLLLNDQGTDRVTQLFRESIEPLIKRAESQLRDIQESKDRALLSFGENLQQLKTQEGDIDPTHLAKHSEYKLQDLKESLAYWRSELEKIKTSGDTEAISNLNSAIKKISLELDNTEKDFKKQTNGKEHTRDPQQDVNAFWKELGNHYLGKALKTHDADMLERFDYRDNDPIHQLKPFGWS